MVIHFETNHLKQIQAVLLQTTRVITLYLYQQDLQTGINPP